MTFQEVAERCRDMADLYAAKDDGELDYITLNEEDWLAIFTSEDELGFRKGLGFNRHHMSVGDFAVESSRDVPVGVVRLSLKER